LDIGSIGKFCRYFDDDDQGMNKSDLLSSLNIVFL
jgi:hypothetical protein